LENNSFSGESEIYFNYHRVGDLQETFVGSGFIVIRLDRQEYIEPDGSVTNDLIFVAEKQ